MKGRNLVHLSNETLGMDVEGPLRTFGRRSCEGFPRVLTIYGDTECCADENAIFASNARKKGVDVQEFVVKVPPLHSF
jgi:hypothetical protein